MPFKAVNGLSMHYQWHEALVQSGQPGQPTVLLAGMASDSASWQPVIEGLRLNHTLIVPDNRCTGQTLPNPVATDRAAMVTDVLALLDSLEIPLFHIVGHSMGGMLGWAIAAEAPHRVAHLVAAAAPPSIISARISLFSSLSALREQHTEEYWYKLLFQFLFKADFFDSEANVQAAVIASQAYPHKQGMNALAAQVAGLNSFLAPPDLASIRCPVTLIAASHDVLFPPDMLAQCQHLHPVMTTHVIDQAAHAMHWEQPEEFIRCVLAALKDK